MYTWKCCAFSFCGLLACLALFGCGSSHVSGGGSSPIQVSVQLAGTGGGSVASIPGGINCGATCSASFHTATSITLTATPDAKSTFTGWSGACSGTGTCTLSPTSNASVTATFDTSAATSYALTVQDSGTGTGTVVSSPAGINCGQTCSASFASGTSVTLTATPSANSTFAGWSGACSGTGTCTVALSASTTVTAIFNTVAVTNYTLTVQDSGTGSGTVTSSPAGINCGSTCSASFQSGTALTLTATPGANSTFAGWSGACSGTSTCTVTLSGNTTVTAMFNTVAVTNYTLTVQDSGTGSGTVTSSPAGINCGSSCSASFQSGTGITLTATPGANSTFAGWSGACSGTGTCNVTLSGNTAVTAAFNTAAPTSYMLTVQTSGTGSVTSAPAGIDCGTTCSASFQSGTVVTLTATPGTNYTFTGWSGACTGTASCSVTVSADTAVTATFTVSSTAGLSKLNHIIVLAQENRSFDHILGALRDYWAKNGYPDQSFDGLAQFNPAAGAAPLNGPAPSNPGCDPSSPPPAGCVFDTTHPVTSYHLITQCIENPSPSWNEAHVDWNYGDQLGLYNDPLLNGFVYSAGHDARNDGFNDVNGVRAMGYYNGDDLNYYYFMASNFATSDRWFHPVMTRTAPNRHYLLAGTSQGRVYPNDASIPADASLLTAKTIFEELQSAGISWKIYVDPQNSGCSGPPYDPACLLKLSYIQDFQFGQTIPSQYPQNIAPISQYFTDVQNGTLPQVALIEPGTDAGTDEHPSTSDTALSNIQTGAQYVSTLINGLMSSSSWKDSVFILTYDEAGGLYDHVPPQPTVSPDGIKPQDLQQSSSGNDVCTTATGPLCDFTYTGYRVPLIVISPYAKKNYVSHTVTDYTAILKLIETRFSVPALTARDAAQMDMTEFFDFSNPSWMAPPSPPVQNTSGACYQTSVP